MGPSAVSKWTNYSKLLRMQMDQPTIQKNSQDSSGPTNIYFKRLKFCYKFLNEILPQY